MESFIYWWVVWYLGRRLLQLVLKQTRHVTMASLKTVPPSKTGPKILTMESLNPNIRVMEYAVRGPIVARAAEIEKELQQVCTLLDSSWSIAVLFSDAGLFLYSLNIGSFSLEYILYNAPIQPRFAKENSLQLLI